MFWHINAMWIFGDYSIAKVTKFSRFGIFQILIDMGKYKFNFFANILGYDKHQQ